MEQHHDNNEDGRPENERQDAPETEARTAENDERYPVPKVWVASLSDYNAGRLHGAWVDVADEETLWEGVRAVLASSPVPGAEEWAFHDYEGFGPLRIGEYEAVADLARLGAGIAEHGAAFAHFAQLVGWSDAERLEHFEDCFQGHFDDLASYGEYVIESYDFQAAIDSLPDLLIPYVRIDSAAFARDMEIGGMITTSEGDGGIYVFEEVW